MRIGVSRCRFPECRVIPPRRGGRPRLCAGQTPSGSPGSHKLAFCVLAGTLNQIPHLEGIRAKAVPRLAQLQAGG